MGQIWITRVARHAARAFGGALGIVANGVALVTILFLPTAALLDLIPLWVATLAVPAVLGGFLLVGAYRVAQEDRSMIQSLTAQVLKAKPPAIATAQTPAFPLMAPTSRWTNITVRDSGGDGISIGHGDRIIADNVEVTGSAGTGIRFRDAAASPRPLP